MARSSSSAALCALLAAVMVAGAFAQYPPPYGTYPPPYPPPPAYPPPPSPASTTPLTGYARFLGPLSTDCTYVNGNTTANVGAGGSVSATALSMVLANGTSCKDVFTGLTLPYPAAGDSPSNASFQVSSTATISYRASAIQPASYSYSQLSVLATSRFDAVDVYQVLRTGNSSAWSILATDLQFIAFNQLLIGAVQATNVTGTGFNCSSAALIQAAIANYFATTTVPVWTTLTAATTSVLARCNASSIAATTVLTNSVTTAWAFYRAVSPTLGRSPQAINLPIFARFASLFQASSLTTLTGITNTSALVSALNGAAIVPDQIGTYLGLSGNTPAASASAAVSAVGPLTGVTPTFWPYSNSMLVNTTLAATVTASDYTKATTTNAATYFGFFTVPEGAVDVLLSPDPTNTSSQVKTLAPFSGVVTFANSSSSGVLTYLPIAAAINATWWAAQSTVLNSTTNDLPVPTAITPADYRTQYYTVLGSTTASTIFAKEQMYNLQYRDFPAGGYTQAAVAVVDTLVPAIPGLGAFFLYKAVNTSSRYPLRDVSNWLYAGTASVNSSSHTNVDFVTSALYSVYLTLGGAAAPSPPPPSAYGSYPPPYPPPPSYPPPPAAGRRALLQTPATITDVLKQVSTAITNTNQLITEQIATVSAAANAGTPVNMTALLTRLAQVAAVQQTDLATALSAIAAKVASGDLNGALTLAQAAALDFSGASLLAKVLAKQINTAAVNAIASGGFAPPPPADSSDDNKKKLALGLGLGLGLGIPLAIGAVAGVVYCIKARRAQQETAPAAATAEGLYQEQEVPAASVATSTAQLATYYRARVGSSSAV